MSVVEAYRNLFLSVKENDCGDDASSELVAESGQRVFFTQHGMPEDTTAAVHALSDVLDVPRSDVLILLCIGFIAGKEAA